MIARMQIAVDEYAAVCKCGNACSSKQRGVEQGETIGVASLVFYEIEFYWVTSDSPVSASTIFLKLIRLSSGERLRSP